MKTTFEDLARDIEKFDEKLNRPVAFYQEVGQSYHVTARMIATRVLMGAMPPGEDAERWKVKVDRAVTRIVAQSMSYGALVLTMFEEAESGALAPKSARPAAQRIGHADVVEWIKAGVNGMEGGKKITATDRKRIADAGSEEKGYRAIATIVMRAYYSNRAPANYTRLRRAIQGYLFGTDEESGSKTLDAVAIAWVEHFTVRQHRDLKGYVGRLCREF